MRIVINGSQESTHNRQFAAAVGSVAVDQKNLPPQLALLYSQTDWLLAEFVDPVGAAEAAAAGFRTN